MLITKSELAARHGVTLETVAGWKRRGLLRMRNGKVDEEPTEAILAQRSPSRRRDRPRRGETPEEFVTRTVIDGGNAPWTIEEAQRIKENALARLREVEASQAEGNSVLVDDVMEIVAAEYLEVKFGLLSLGSRLAPRLAHMRDPEQIRVMIDDAVHAALDALGSKTAAIVKRPEPAAQGNAENL